MREPLATPASHHQKKPRQRVSALLMICRLEFRTDF